MKKTLTLALYLILAHVASAQYYFNPTRVSSDSVCDGSSVKVSVSTNIPFSLSNHFSLKVTCTQAGTCSGVWHSDSIYAHQGGTYTFSLPDSVTNYRFDCADHDDFNLYLLTSDTAMEIPLGRITIYAAPSIAYAPTLSLCLGDNRTVGGYLCPSQTSKLFEEPSHALISTSASSFIAPTQTTTYSMEVTRTICRIDTSFTITVLPNPTLALADSLILTCRNDSTTLRPNAVDTTLAYVWLSGSGESYLTPSITVLPTSNETYALTAYDTNRCWTQRTAQVSIKQPLYQDICMVTVDSGSTHNVVVWEKYDKPATDSFYIYREVSTNTYVRIAAVHKDSLSEYHDYGANPNSTGYRYRISALDTCGNEGYESFYHNSIHLQYLGGGNLQWNNYEIESSSTPVASYDILRDDNNTGAWSQILNVSGTQNTASDAAFESYPNAHYKVVANWSYSCNPSRAFQASLSNSIMTQPNGIISNNEMSFSISPNPTSGVLHISFPKLVSGSITIKDVTGKGVITADVKASVNETIHIEHLPAGIYIATFRNAESTYSQKVVKE